MNLIKPKKLKKGDTIGVIAASGNIENISDLEVAKKYFEKKGYKIVFSENVYSKHRYLAGTDEERASAVNNFFEDDSINAIICARGGYGAIRLLDKIDYDLIKSKPKIFAGYSDVSALLTMIYKRTGLVTFHSPMFCSDFVKVLDYTETNFIDCLNGNIQEWRAKDYFKAYYLGIANGILWGGNLSTLSSLAGLDFVPDEPFLWTIEDIGEPVYKIDKMVTQLLNIKNFKKNLSGIVLGDFTDVDDSKWLDELFEDVSKELKIPTMNGFKFGHEKLKITYPIGIKAKIDTNQGFLNLLENPFS